MRWLAVGTGRCGTKSLTAWGGTQGARHESVHLPFQGKDGELARVISERMAHPEPEVSFMWTAHWRIARKFDPDLPIIRCHRDKWDTVASHVRICSGRDRLVPGRMKGDLFNSRYPKLADTRDPYQAWAYWYDLIEALMAEIQGPTFDLDLEDLNDPQRMADLQTWLEAHGRWI